MFRDLVRFQISCLLLVSILDIDAKEGKPQNDAHGGRHTQDGVDGGIHSCLLNPGVGSVFRRFCLVFWPNHGVAALHV